AARCCSSGCSLGRSLSFFAARWHSPISWRTPDRASGPCSTAGSWRRFTASCSSISPQRAAGPGASTTPDARAVENEELLAVLTELGKLWLSLLRLSSPGG